MRSLKYIIKNYRTRLVCIEPGEQPAPIDLSAPMLRLMVRFGQSVLENSALRFGFKPWLNIFLTIFIRIRKKI